MKTSRKLVIAGNWKLNKTIKEAVEFVTLLKRNVRDSEKTDVIVCPPYTALSDLAEILMDSDIRLAAQDLFWEEKGAFTGEISAAQIKDAGASYVLIGHSERRQFFHETNETVNRKLKTALKNGLLPIVCVGESLEERESARTWEVLESQLKGGFAELSVKDVATVLMAYEPVWAIGTGKVATPAQAQEAHCFIRRWVKDRFDAQIASRMRLLYGGSVKPDNIAELVREEDIDGALVGGASLDAQSFTEIIKNCLAALATAKN